MTWEEEQQKQLKEKDLTLQKLQQEMPVSYTHLDVYKRQALRHLIS